MPSTSYIYNLVLIFRLGYISPTTAPLSREWLQHDAGIAEIACNQMVICNLSVSLTGLRINLLSVFGCKFSENI